MPGYQLKMEYYDDENTGLFGHYVSDDPEAPVNGACKDFPDSVSTAGMHTWNRATFVFSDALFESRENAGGDFRIKADNGSLTIRRVSFSAVP